MFDLRQLRYFIAVAEELSFTRAAERLHISQPPLSQQIQALEFDLNVRLFDRNSRKVALTEPGYYFLEQAREIVARSTEVRRQLVSVASGLRGELRAACTASAALHPLLLQIISQQAQHAPNVQVHVSEMPSERQFAGILKGDLDVGLVATLPQSDVHALHFDIVDREPLLLALPAAHPLARRQHVALANMSGPAALPFVAQPRELDNTLYDRLGQLAAHAGFRPAIRHHAQHITSLLTLVAAGVGALLVPAAVRNVRLAGVSYVSLTDPDAYLLMAFARRKDDHSPMLSQFLGIVRRIVSERRERRGALSPVD
ncbi:MAG: LysR substrate-binding domain-containing protein [Burkholderia sp.]